MRVNARLRRGFVLVAFLAVALLAAGALRSGGHATAAHASIATPGAALTADQGVVAAAPAVLRADASAGRAPNRVDLGTVVGTGSLAGLVLLAWLLVALPWSGTALGARGWLPGRRSPPLLLS